jgi:hypothetical protein
VEHIGPHVGEAEEVVQHWRLWASMTSEYLVVVILHEREE